jgi:hypothetical protein
VRLVSIFFVTHKEGERERGRERGREGERKGET